MSSRIVTMADYPGLPGSPLLAGAFLVAHAVHHGKELHINRDGSTTIEGLPVAEYFGPPPRHGPPAAGKVAPTEGSANIFRLVNGEWELSFGGVYVPREPDLIGLRYLHKLLEHQRYEVSAFKLMVLVSEPEDCMKEAELLEGDVATDATEDDDGDPESAPCVVTTEFWDKFYDDEDRGALLDMLEKAKEDVGILQAKGKVIEAVQAAENAKRLEDWMEQNVPKKRTDAAYFPSRAKRAAASVGNAVRRAIERLEPSHPPLAEHLTHSIELGMHCCYNPKQPVRWVL
jgi:hypothetical protein